MTRVAMIDFDGVMSDSRQIGEVISEMLEILRKLQKEYERDHGDPILPCKEAASLLGKTPQTISRYIREGRLHKVSNGVSTGIRHSELRKFINRD